MKIESIPSVRGMRLAAKSRLPKAVFDFIDGGSDDESTLARNTGDFADYTFAPRVLRDVSERRIDRAIFGRKSSAPIIIAATGLAALARPGAELLLAKVAKAHDIPFTLSTAASCSIEDIAGVDPERRWFQLYVFKNREVTRDLMRRAAASGYEALAVTADVPVLGKRERDVING
ncbi:MAG: alpha-hydroxy-acid oxidizing protein, partial [Gammaproteobacteria bacterium]|nr:alpha-hydroxy-acid oxidizing protein [Gammaproteobacteria bacterium]